MPEAMRDISFNTMPMSLTSLHCQTPHVTAYGDFHMFCLFYSICLVNPFIAGGWLLPLVSATFEKCLWIFLLKTHGPHTLSVGQAVASLWELGRWYPRQCQLVFHCSSGHLYPMGFSTLTYWQINRASTAHLGSIVSQRLYKNQVFIGYRRHFYTMTIFLLDLIPIDSKQFKQVLAPHLHHQSHQ